MKKLSTLGIVILIIGIMAFLICDIIVPKNLSELKKDPLTGENAKNYYGLCQALSAIPPFVYCVGALLSISGFIKGQKHISPLLWALWAWFLP